MVKEALILAGGFGTRISGLFPDIPKPLIPINNTPFIKLLIDNLVNNGIIKIHILVGYKSDQIIEYLQSLRYFDINFIKETTPLGTGGAILNALSKIENDDFFICNGDTFIDFDLKAFYKFFLDNDRSPCILIKTLENPIRYGLVEINRDRKIIKFYQDKNARSGLINLGSYLFNKNFFNKLTHLPKKFSFEHEILMNHNFLNEFYTFESPGIFIDIGVPEDYYKANDLLKHY